MIYFENRPLSEEDMLGSVPDSYQPGHGLKLITPGPARHITFGEGDAMSFVCTGATQHFILKCVCPEPGLHKIMVENFCKYFCAIKFE